MTYLIPQHAATAKALAARRFAVELERALKARGVTYNELGRASGVGHTAVDHYKNAAILPRLASAKSIADALDWPRLYQLVLHARSGVCANRLCKQPFVNDGGSSKVYCSHRCRDVAGKLRASRSQSQAKDARTRRAAIDNVRGALRELRTERDDLREAIAEMCRECEPDGVCKAYDCPLRPVSPLPLNDRRIGSGEARRDFDLRSERWTPERRAAAAERIALGEIKNFGIAALEEHRRNETDAQRAARWAKASRTQRINFHRRRLAELEGGIANGQET